MTLICKLVEFFTRDVSRKEFVSSAEFTKIGFSNIYMYIFFILFHKHYLSLPIDRYYF